MRVRIVAGLVGVLLGASALWVTRREPVSSLSGGSWPATMLLICAGGSLLIGGLMVGGGPSRHRVVGALLVAASYTWFMGAWINPQIGAATLFTAGLVLGPLVPALVAAAVLVSPSGRVSNPAIAVCAAAGAGLAVIFAVLATLWFDPASGSCPSCAANVFAVSDAPARFVAIGRAGLTLTALWSLGAICMAAWRVARAGRPAHVVLVPMTVSLIAFLAVIARADWSVAARGFIGTAAPDRRSWMLQAATLILVAGSLCWAELVARRRRARVARLVVDLGRSTTSGGVRALLAEALGDPDVLVAYPIDARCVDADGHDVTEPTAPGVTTTPIMRDGTLVALVTHRSSTTEETADLADATGLARLALENERLNVELRVRDQELRRSRARTIDACDETRRRLERDLHDGAQQRLVALIARTRVAQSRASDNPASAGRCAAITAELQAAIASLRDIAHGLYAPVLDDEGLAPALESLADESDMLVIADDLHDSRFATNVERAAYWVAAELARSGATRLSARRDASSVRLELEVPAKPPRLVDVEDRVGALDGSTIVRDIGSHVCVQVEIPCG